MCGLQGIYELAIKFSNKKIFLFKQVEQWKEYFEICSLVGTLADSGHLHTVLGREDGSTISGHVMGKQYIFFKLILLKNTHTFFFFFFR